MPPTMGTAMRCITSEPVPSFHRIGSSPATMAVTVIIFGHHAFVVLGLLAVLALGILSTPVAAWLKTGVLGIALGSLIIGLAWPYLVGRLGADVGVTVTALGGLALVIGGVTASWATRHAEPDPSV